MHEGSTGASRRAYLGAIAGGSLGTAGCLGRLGRTIERDEPKQVSVSITTVPQDNDLYSLRIANHLAANMEAVGIAVDVVPTRRQNLLRNTLINRDFDMYVGRHPGQTDPDVLYELFHSGFAQELGWQNPTSYTNTMADEMLNRQRRSGDRRVEGLGELQQLLYNELPLIPLAFERFYSVLAADRVERRTVLPVGHSFWPATLDVVQSAADEGAEDGQQTLRLGSIDGRLTQNLNPLAVNFRGPNDITELLYEPLARWDGSQHLPWLADSWRWVSPQGAAAPTIEVFLRPDLRWHDGTRITATDVAFTYRLLQDTTMQGGDPTIPAPRFRGLSSLVDTVGAYTEDTVRIQFVETTPQIGRRVLSLPILPEHVWSQRTGLSEIGGIEISDQTTDAVIADNLLPVGSGPFECTEVRPEEGLTFSRFDAHFLGSVNQGDPVAAYEGLPGADRLRIELRPSEETILTAIRNGDLDGSLSNLGVQVTEGVDTEQGSNLRPLDSPTAWLLHIGFNLRRVPFTIVGFRQAVGHLIDREYLLSEVFHGGADATVTPIADNAYVPSELSWPMDGQEGFAGESGTGEVDPERAKQYFRNAGFQYASDGQLLIHN